MHDGKDDPDIGDQSFMFGFASEGETLAGGVRVGWEDPDIGGQGSDALARMPKQLPDIASGVCVVKEGAWYW